MRVRGKGTSPFFAAFQYAPKSYISLSFKGNQIKRLPNSDTTRQLHRVHAPTRQRDSHFGGLSPFQYAPKSYIILLAIKSVVPRALLSRKDG